MSETTETIRFIHGECSLGVVLVATSRNGVVAISLGDSVAALESSIVTQFPQAQAMTEDDGWLDQVIGLIENPRQPIALPLDMRGTNFQKRVWQALLTIPPGETRTYSQIAEQIGAPNAMRGVGSACSANRIAVAVPCHRVIRNDGTLAGYRWGGARKRILIEREKLATFATIAALMDDQQTQSSAAGKR